MTVPQKNDFKKISPTAFLVTYARQFSDIPYTQDIVHLVDSKTVADQFIPDTSSFPVYMAVLIEGRYKAINRVLAKFETTQIIELASGLLPRGMILSENPNLTFVESDLPEMIALKQPLVRKLIGERPNLFFEVIDVTRQPSQFPIGADYLREDRPVTILCEGLLPYLNFAEKKQVFANVREVLLRYGGVWITTDLITQELRQKVQKNHPAMQAMNESISANTGRSLEDNRFNTLAEVKQFVSEQGFKIEQHSTLEIMRELACVEKLKIDPNFVNSLLASLPVFSLTLNL